MKDIVVCFPSSQINTVKLYLKNKGIGIFESATDLEDAARMLKELTGEDNNLHIFDFIDENGLYRPFIENSHKFKNVEVITTQREVANTYSDITSNIRLVTPLMDLMFLFWDSPVFSLTNIENAETANIPLIKLNDMKIDEGSIGRAEIFMKTNIVKNNETKIGLIEIGCKTKKDKVGKILDNEEFGVKDLVGRVGVKVSETISELLDNSDSVKEKANNEAHNISEESIKTIMDSNFASNISEFMLNENTITKEIFNVINELEREGQSKSRYDIVDFCVEKGWIDERAAIDTVSQYYRLNIYSKEKLNELSIQFKTMKLDSCVELNAFCVRGEKPNGVYVVLDVDNHKAKSEIQSRFNSYNLIYSRDRYIRERLEEEKSKMQSKTHLEEW